MKRYEEHYFGGASWRLHLDVTDPAGTAIDFRGSMARVQFRLGTADAAAAATLTESSGITLGNGTVDLALEIPEAWAGDYGWELRVVSTSGEVIYYFAGLLTVSKPNSRAS